MAKSIISLFIRSCSLPTGVEEERAKVGVSLFLSLLCVLVFYSYLCPITIHGGGGSSVHTKFHHRTHLQGLLEFESIQTVPCFH